MSGGPLSCPPALSRAEHAALRSHLIFDCGKLDPQCEDVDVLARYPVVLERAEWEELAAVAERLASETLNAERELLARPDLQRELGLARSILGALGAAEVSDDAPRCLRFDFHPTTEDWRLSEVNSDVPGGFIEASGLARAMAERYEGSEPAGDPAGALVHAVLRGCGGGEIGLVHATAYTDDRQVMAFLARRFETAGAHGRLLAPDQIAWIDGHAAAITAGAPAPLDALVRFYPAEWLPLLPRASGWRWYFQGAVLQTNPPSALLTQSKRFPLVWDRLSTRMEAWRAALPETRDPRDTGRLDGDEWVLKPALGRVGDGVGIRGVVGGRDWRRIRREARSHPRHWAAQRRFEPLPLHTPDGPRNPCIGVFVIDGRACGAYGRIAERPLIDARSQDVAVLLAASAPDGLAREKGGAHGRAAAAL